MIHPLANSRRIILSVLLATAPLGACNFKDEKDGAKDENGVIVDPAVPTSFTEIQTKILKPSCTGCHSVGGGNQGGVNLETYTAVKAEIADIKSSTIDSSRMPQGDSLSSNLRALLKAWIEQGAPE
jgi:uncharacterized membrane protein